MRSEKKVSLLKLGGSAGIFTPVSALVFISTSILSYRGFSWTNNALSDLGVISDPTATLFNFGLFLSGLLALAFSIGLFVLFQDRLSGKIGAGVFVLACLSLEGISFFNENVRPFHYIFSVAFFVFMPISLLIIAGYYIETRQKWMVVFTLLMALIAAAPWVLQFTFPYVANVAIPEAISSVAGSVWVLVTSYNMFKKAAKVKVSIPVRNKFS